jgi:transketolase
VTAEDHSIIGGLGGAVAEHMTSNILAPLERVGVRDRFGESGQADEMLNVMEISTPFIADAARRAIARKG